MSLCHVLCRHCGNDWGNNTNNCHKNGGKQVRAKQLLKNDKKCKVPFGFKKRTKTFQLPAIQKLCQNTCQRYIPTSLPQDRIQEISIMHSWGGCG